MPIRSAAGAVSGLGFVDYNDTGGDVSVQADTWTTVTNDGAGAFTNKGFTVSGVTEVMDSVGRLDFQYLSLGDGLLVRTDVTVTPSVNGLSMEVRWNLGTTSPYSVSSSLGSLVSVTVTLVAEVKTGATPEAVESTNRAFSALAVAASDTPHAVPEKST